MRIDYLYDQEVDTYGTTVQCEDCDHVDDAVEMRRQSDGSWLCPRCERECEREWRQIFTIRTRGYYS